MRRRLRLVRGGLSALALLLFAAASDAQPRHVLILQSLDRGSLTFDTITSHLTADLDARSPQPITFSQVVVNPSGFGFSPEDAVISYLRDVYSRRSKPDLVVSIGGPAAAFARQHRKALFPDSPMLFTAFDDRFLRDTAFAPDEAAVPVHLDYAAMIDDILQLFPETSNVFVVLGSGALSRFWRGELEREFERFRNRVSFTWSDSMSFAEILRQVATLPPRSAVFHFSFSTDTQGGTFADERTIGELRAASSVPVFGSQSPMLGHGIVGGRLMRVEDGGRAASEAALRILNGESPGSVRMPTQLIGPPVFDWRELQRWGVSQGRLPAGSEIRYRPPSVWEQYRWTIVAIAIALAAQTALIVALLRSRGKLTTARASLSRLSGRLITAQEEERRRVARELHDDVGQRMAMLTMDLGQLHEALPQADTRARAMASDLSDDVSALASDIQGISRRLHSSNLEYLGLEAAARNLCAEVAAQRGVAVDYAHDQVPAQVPADVALNVFRVLQEALANAAKHAGARRCVVSLRGTRDALLLEVTDDGRGFDAGAAARGQGLGLVSMQERVTAIGGTIDVASKPGSGTVVRLRVPLVASAADAPIAPNVYAR